MRKLRQLYTLGVLWLLSVVATDAAETIYRHGHDDGANELREWMRKELMALQVVQAADRARSYQQGFRDAMRLFDDEPQVEIVERVN